MKCPDLGDILKIGRWFLSGVKGLLHTAGVRILAQISMLPHGLTQKCIDFLN
jgi:hypothetical protein